jgi:hypothetical protein
VPIWVFNLTHHLHAQYRLNLIQKSYLKLDLIWRRHNLGSLEKKDVKKSQYVALEMHACKSFNMAREMHKSFQTENLVLPMDFLLVVLSISCMHYSQSSFFFNRTINFFYTLSGIEGDIT